MFHRNVSTSSMITLCAVVIVCTLAGCGTSSLTTSPSSSTTPASNLMAGFKEAKWTKNVTVTYANGMIEIKSDGIPYYGLQSEYIVPNQGVVIPTASSSYVVSSTTSVKTQNYDLKITTSPAKAATSTSTSLGTIGIMIDGAVLYNPYEGDNSTVALAANFTIKDAKGNSVAFIDSCNGHITPQGIYHYHGLPSCITSAVDGASGPSHMIGIALDGYPIYGDRDINGKTITSSQLDACNGITSATPEFPQGVYHYILLNTPSAASSIKCFTGTANMASMPAMNMPGMPSHP